MPNVTRRSIAAPTREVLAQAAQRIAQLHAEVVARDVEGQKLSEEVMQANAAQKASEAMLQSALNQVSGAPARVAHGHEDLVSDWGTPASSPRQQAPPQPSPEVSCTSSPVKADGVDLEVESEAFASLTGSEGCCLEKDLEAATSPRGSLAKARSADVVPLHQLEIPSGPRWNLFAACRRRCRCASSAQDGGSTSDVQDLENLCDARESRGSDESGE
eukprot:gnl/TRDRNA2_/TRDRNA2_152714_c1_seq1.p1 gnl/TRDRNA2_/TRDRNA2_152714_c1~~gnl/TRDRNA2_/TRDRNA2_152714_c1_seq1.p1  ORF type:complete len:231 (-),score=35.67 gnl/TRDRNA2_/TRDRNA2_152714_c1_seq1:42-692(-)